MTNPRVLVVDDHHDTLQLFGAYLSLAGFHVTLATSAREALELTSDGFDAITTDVAMPDMDGVEFIREVRQGRRYRGPIIAVTGQAPGTIRLALESSGCCRVLTKPCDLAELARTMRTLVDTCVRDCNRCPDSLRATAPSVFVPVRP
jgi:CheY-like chemotaxis protein